MAELGRNAKSHSGDPWTNASLGQEETWINHPIVFIKQLMAQGAHQTLYKGILLLQIEKYKIAPKAIQYICGYLDTTQYPTASKYPVFPNQHKDGRNRLRQSNIVPCKECCLFKNNSDLI